jgi:hypothetical protein
LPPERTVDREPSIRERTKAEQLSDFLPANHSCRPGKYSLDGEAIRRSDDQAQGIIESDNGKIQMLFAGIRWTSITNVTAKK